MNSIIDELDETQVPELALKALQNAQVRVRTLGRPQVLVVNGQLVRIFGGQQTVLKILPQRKRIRLRKATERK
jgi:hypothetical protein